MKKVKPFTTPLPSYFIQNHYLTNLKFIFLRGKHIYNGNKEIFFGGKGEEMTRYESNKQKIQKCRDMNMGRSDFVEALCKFMEWYNERFAKR